MKKIFAAAIFSLLCVSVSAQWQKIDVPFDPLLLSAVDSNTLWCCTFNTGQVARTTNAGDTWDIRDIPNAQGFLLREFISAIDSSKAWISFYHYSSGINYVYKTLDGGQSWQQRNPGNLSSGQIINFQKFYNINNGILLSHDFNNHVFVYRTTNGGQSWTTKILSINGAHLGTATYGDKNIWFYTGSGEIWRSYDGGTNWSTFQTSLEATSYGLAMDFADSLNGLAFKDHYFNQLYRTVDGGASWQPVNNPGNPAPSSTFVWGLTKIPDLPHAWIVGYNDGTAYTLDDGDNWVTESNYPDFDFRQPAFLNSRQGWGIAGSTSAVFRWQDAIDESLAGCVAFIGPLTGKLRRSDCDQIWFQGSIRADIANDPDIHLRTTLSYPDNTMFPVTQYQILNNVSTACPSCPLHFVPDSGQTTIGELRFDIPVAYAYDTSQTILCSVSPTQCGEDTSNMFQFRTGYFANWFHPECFEIDTSDCAIELKTNVCGIDTNQYLIYYRVQDGAAVLGNHYEKNPSYYERIRFYIFAFGDYQNSTCYEVIDTLYFCGVSETIAPPTSKAVTLQLAPNPATNAFQIFCDNLPGQQVHIVRIRNAAGVLKWSQTLPQGAPSLFIENNSLSNGFYIVELWSDNTLVAFKKLVVVKNN